MPRVYLGMRICFFLAFLAVTLGACGGPTAPPARPDAPAVSLDSRAAGAPSSTRLGVAPADGIAILDVANTPANEERVDRVLSAAGVPFHLAPLPPSGWSKVSIRFALTVARADVPRVESLLKAETDAGRLTVVAGTRDLIGRF